VLITAFSGPGIIVASDFEGDQLEKGPLVQQVFEQVFPNKGSELDEFCVR